MSEFGALIRKHEKTQHALKKNSSAGASHHVVVTGVDVSACVSECVRSMQVCVLRQFATLCATGKTNTSFGDCFGIDQRDKGKTNTSFGDCFGIDQRDQSNPQSSCLFCLCFEPW